jgi:hypothetical protein
MTFQTRGTQKVPFADFDPYAPMEEKLKAAGIWFLDTQCFVYHIPEMLRP